jgi:poly(hydroxyalkanoate) depolymerase family esterase
MNMNESFQDPMRDITRMVKSGRLLMDATQAIQMALGILPPADGHVSAAGGAKSAPLEGVFRMLDGTFPTASGWEERLPLHAPTPEFHFRVPPDSPLQGFTMPASLPGAVPATVPEVAPGAQFIAGSFANAEGTRCYKLYVPSSYEGQAQALPLVVMLHGGTQSPDDFAAGTRMNTLAEEYPCLVLYPSQAPGDNVMKCWNWFKEADQQRDSGEPSLIAGMTQEIMAKYRVDARRVYVAGISAGGAMAAVMGATYPDLFAAVGVHSGLAHGVAHDLPSALAAMQGNGMAPARPPNASGAGTGSETRTVPTIVFHGDRDTIVNPRNADQIILHGTTRYHARAGTNPCVAAQPGQVPGGHAYTRTVYQETDGQPFQEHWQVHGAGHAWSGGSTNGSYTDPKGPDASREMLRFFNEHAWDGSVAKF